MVASFSYGLEDDPVVSDFDKLATAEGLDRSKLLVQLIKDYVLKHGKGNPAFTLEKFQDPLFLAFPTLGEILQPDQLDKLPNDDLKLLWKAAKGRSQEVAAATKRRGWIEGLDY